MQGLLTMIMCDLQYKDYKRDVATLVERVRHEGIPFMTKALPTLGSAVMSALCSGHFHCPPSFRTRRGSVLPVFLYGALSKVFNDDGALTEASPSEISTIRQVCFTFYKMKWSLDPIQVRDAAESYIRRDIELPQIRSDVDLTYASDIVHKLFRGFRVDSRNFRFGPGATSDARTNSDKFAFQQFYQSLDAYIPYSWVFPYTPSAGFSWNGENRVLFVPKDSRGPRTIACEPPEYMFYQQLLGRSMMDHLSRYPFINFTDQRINQDLAREGSLTRVYNTLDLKDASDSVSLDIVRHLFADTSLLPGLEAARTPVSVLPDGRKLFLKKYAAMGSALCFPVESVVFYALLRAYHKAYEPKNRLFVYGDDIITTARDPVGIREFLAKYGFKVNTSKSFFYGNFRESCGGNFLLGSEVNYIKCNDLEPVSLVACANQLYAGGYHAAAEYIRSALPRIPSGYASAYTFAFGPKRGHSRINRKLHRLEVKTWSPRSSFERTTDEGAIFRHFLGLNGKFTSAHVVGSRSRRHGWTYTPIE